jgi:hypothetical protein
MKKKIQFHWRMLQGGEPDVISRARQLEVDCITLPDIPNQVAFCKLAEDVTHKNYLLFPSLVGFSSLFCTKIICPS